MKYWFKNITASFSLPITILLSAGCLALWLPDFMQAATGTPVPYQLLYLPVAFSFKLHPLWILSSCLLLSILNAVLLMQFIYQLGISRMRSFMPVFLYMLAMGSVRSLHMQAGVQLTILIFFAISFLLYNMFKSRVEVEKVFLSTLLLTLSSMLVPDMLFLIPVLWIAYVILQAFSFRVWLASLVALMTVVLFSAVYVLLSGSGAEVAEAFQVMFSRTWQEFFSSWFFCGLFVALTLFFLLFLGAFYADYFRDGVHTQAMFNVLVLLFFVCVAVIIFPATALPVMSGLELTVISCFAIHFFQSVKSIFRSIIYLLYIAVFLTYWLLSVLNITL